MSPMTAARRRGLQRLLLALGGLLTVVLFYELVVDHGRPPGARAGGLVAGIAACLLAAALLPSDVPGTRPPPAVPGGDYADTRRFGMGRTAWRQDYSPEPDPRVAELAARAGWTYRARDRRVENYRQAPLKRGVDRYDVVTGTVDGVPFTAFSYGTRIGPGRPPIYRVVAVPLPGPMPPLAVGPERLLRSVAPALGLPDVDLESEAFNRTYRVLARDRRYAVTMLPPRTAEMLLGTEPFAWRIEESVLLSWDESLADPAGLPLRIEQVTAIVRHAPAFVWEQYALPS